MSYQSRHGVTLLFVVSMIVLFLLMGTAFVVISTDFLRHAKKRARFEVHEIDADAILERAFYDLVREPDLDDSHSPLRGHSLLGDMYGYGFTTTVSASAAHPSRQFLTLKLDLAGKGRNLLDRSGYQRLTTESLAGRVLSFVSGPATGMVARIVDHQVTQGAAAPTDSFVIQPDWGDTDFRIERAGELVGSNVVVNGRPFSGTGAGNYDPHQPLNKPALSATALEPNQVGRSRAEMIGRSNNGYLSTGAMAGTGHMPHSASTNEPYDTFDFQNMFLAGMNPDGSIAVPSFHRPSLVKNYPTRSDFRAFQSIGPGSENSGIVVDNDNNGQADGVWIDIGLPTQTTSDGTHFKPLVSYTVVDLDGRINVNAHGNPYELDRAMTEISMLGLPAGPLHRGAGYGPPEISMGPLLSDLIADQMQARYGIDGKPGQANVRDTWSAYKLFGYPNAPFDDALPGTVGGDFGSAMDVHGRFAIGYPDLQREVSDPNFSNYLPMANISTSTLSSEVVDSAYEMSFADGSMAGPDGRGFDAPFTAQDLEGMFRRADSDSVFLSDRLWNLGGGAFSGMHSARDSVTTASFEVPSTVENLSIKLGDILTASGMSADKVQQQIRLLLPAEVRRGLPMNVNRPFSLGDGIDNDNDGEIDELDEPFLIQHPSGTKYEFNDPFARWNFARHLYIVTLLATERVDRNGDQNINASDWFDFNDDGKIDDQDRIDYRKMIGQWAINVVDFRDRDSLMSPFEFDLNPWDGWDVDDNIGTSDPAAGSFRQLVWGSERPELLITETFASHDRRTQDLTMEDKGHLAEAETDGRQDFDSNLLPTASAFFELYNPWVTIDPNQYRPAELYDEKLNGVDLQKEAPGGAPVWRLIVTKKHDVADTDPDDANSPPLETIRRIYFTRPDSSVDSGPEVFYPEPQISVGTVAPGNYAVVGSAGISQGDEYVTYFGRRTTADALNELAATRRIVLNPKERTLTVASWQTASLDLEQRKAVVNIPIRKIVNKVNWNLGVSDPVKGYFNLKTKGGAEVNITAIEDGYKFTIIDQGNDLDFAFDEPVDRMQDAQHYDDYLEDDGVRPAYRTVHLQRMANPLQAYHPLTNPYRTIDSMAIDLVVFNGAEGKTEPNQTQSDEIRFGSFERRSGLTGDGKPAANGQDETNGRQRLLFKNDRRGHQFPRHEDSKPFDNDFHIFNRNLVETLGRFNAAYIAREGQAAEPNPKVPFAWLCWNNRPYASQLELTNVPFTSSYWLTRLFDVADPARNVYQPPSKEVSETEARNYTAHFPYLLNFYADRTQGDASTQGSASLHRLFDFLEVPSRFVGTESYVNPDTFASDQGLSFGMAAPFDTLSNFRYPGKLNVNTILDERVWNGLMRNYATDPHDPLTYQDWTDSRDGSTNLKFANPYRSPLTANWVPTQSLVVSPAECGLFRSDGHDQPLFDYAPPNNQKQLYNNDDRAAYFKYDRRQRLGNLVTGRSSVFAIWITVGLFEVQADGTLSAAQRGGQELGEENGSVQRYRAFYIFDRSIPVAFEPGKNHNVDRAVLIRSRIE